MTTTMTDPDPRVEAILDDLEYEIADATWRSITKLAALPGDSPILIEARRRSVEAADTSEDGSEA